MGTVGTSRWPGKIATRQWLSSRKFALIGSEFKSPFRIWETDAPIVAESAAGICKMKRRRKQLEQKKYLTLDLALSP